MIWLEKSKSKKLPFIAITNYPGHGKNTVVIDFEGDGLEGDAIREQLANLKLLDGIESPEIGNTFDVLLIRKLIII